MRDGFDILIAKVKKNENYFSFFGRFIRKRLYLACSLYSKINSICTRLREFTNTWLYAYAVCIIFIIMLFTK